MTWYPLAVDVGNGELLSGTATSDSAFFRLAKVPQYFGPDLTREHFSGHLPAKFVNANLSKFNLHTSLLFGTDLPNANLTDTFLHGTYFTGATLTGVIWTRARCSRNTIWPTGFSTAGNGMWGPFQDYSGQNLSGRNFSGNDFPGCRFRGTDLSSDCFRGAGLDRADLTHANLRNAELLEANLEGATLTAAILIGATCSSATVWPAGFDPVAAGAVRR